MIARTPRARLPTPVGVLPPEQRARLCAECGDSTRDWYVVDEPGHPFRGDIECAACHERRILRETRRPLSGRDSAE